MENLVVKRPFSKRRTRNLSAAVVGVAVFALAVSMSTATQAATPTSGGTLRVGVTGGGAKDTIDVHMPTSIPDIARAFALTETLATFDTSYRIQMELAQSIVPNKTATEWTIKLRNGLKFSDGRPITSADVIATFKRIANPSDRKIGFEGFQGINLAKTVATDNRTVRVVLKASDSTFVDFLALYWNGIVPADYDPKNPVTAGPFKFKSFTPGQQSVFKKNPYYWRTGQPYLDSLVIIDFPDGTARVNALLSGQVDAIDGLPFGQISMVSANPSLKVLESKTGGFIPFTMRVDRAPFNDVRVRQALRLVVDRPQMIRQVLGGHGTIGNDLYAPLDACYNSSLPQRKRDIARAKALLKAAGKSNLTVELVTSPVASGVVEAAQVFVQQAKVAGITVKLKKVDTGTFYGDNYLKWDFAQDFWYTTNFLPQTTVGSLPNSQYNETHWADAKFVALVAKARQTTKLATRCALIKQAQKIEYDAGGFIIWGFPNQVDAYSVKVQGFVPDASGVPLTSFGFRKVWIKRQP
jgi:peptide/nickel transport system substrate-binding protein